MFRPAAFLGVVMISSAAIGADSVVLGHGVSNAFLSLPPCPTDSLCMDANYVWVLDAVHTVVGPAVIGRARAIASQHTDATAKFVKSIELFVLRPIEDRALQESSGAKYYLVLLSPRYSHGRYCLAESPGDVGLKINPSEVKVNEYGNFCFRATVLASNNRWSGP